MAATPLPAGVKIDPRIGRRVKTRWTENGESKFYEALITDYNPTEV